MKVKILLAIFCANAFLMLSAQEGKFGYIDFNGTLRRMPDYIVAEANLHNIQAEYQEELERSKREFERQYIEFMLEQDHLSNNCVNYVIDRAHEEGCYVIMSIAPSSEWVTIANPENDLVETFANNIVAKINQYGFDGVDLDWEYPTSDQKTWFTELARVVREKVKANNPHHLVTAAVGGGMWQPPRYDLTNSKAYLDYINLMCYDMVQSDGSYQNGLYRTTSYLVWFYFNFSLIIC